MLVSLVRCIAPIANQHPVASIQRRTFLMTFTYKAQINQSIKINEKLVVRVAMPGCLSITPLSPTSPWVLGRITA